MSDAIPKRRGGTVHLQISSQIATITLDNPTKANALSSGMVSAFLKALDDVEKDDEVHAVVLTGAGKYFCSGMDLAAASSSSSSSPQATPFDSSLYIFERLANFPKPTIALINGPALGGGVGLTFCTDVKLMHSSAYFQLSEVKRGLVPAIISLFIVPAIGTSLATQWFLTGERVKAERAWQVGVVAGVGKDEQELKSLVDKYADLLKEGGPSALKTAKELVKVVGGSGTLKEEKKEHVRKVFEGMMVSEEAAYGMGAFMSKKKPDWNEFKRQSKL
ncbi:EnoyL-CoA hydratase [Chytridiales sp. JEL 0842]|nr:EnoyL-CoA hydratase [Chytridiales sp. JEL 0842]